MDSIEVVIISWKRPDNIEKIIKALKQQTIGCRITLCDCHPDNSFRISEDAYREVDRIFRWNFNLGPFSRYLPIPALDRDYTLFLDDDMLPGPRCIEGFINAASQINDFGVLGQFGRILNQDGIYNTNNLPKSYNFTEIDFIVRAYFVKTSNLHHLIKFKFLLKNPDSLFWEDDLLLCASLKYLANLPCFIIPHNDDMDFWVNKEELCKDFALKYRTDHKEIRIKFVKKLISIGWKPLVISQKN